MFIWTYMMKFISIRNNSSVKRPDKSVHASIANSLFSVQRIPVRPACGIRQPTARIGLNKNKISNALRESTKLNLKHEGPIVAEMLRWGQFLCYLPFFTSSSRSSSSGQSSTSLRSSQESIQPWSRLFVSCVSWCSSSTSFTS